MQTGREQPTEEVHQHDPEAINYCENGQEGKTKSEPYLSALGGEPTHQEVPAEHVIKGRIETFAANLIR